MADITIKDKKRSQFLVVNSDDSTTQVLLENTADNVLVEDAGGKLDGATNVEEALQKLADGVADAGKVDDVRNNASDASTSIVTNKIADLSKAVVKEAGQVGHTLTVGNGSNNVSFNGSADGAVSLDSSDFSSTTGTNALNVKLANSGVTAGTYQGLTVDAKGRVTAAVDKGYAVKTDVDTELAKKLDKAGGSVTGDLTIGGNLTVNGTTTSIDSTTLKVSDKLIEVAKDNTVKLTTPAGIVVPKYDGTNYGALVIDGDGNAQVGDVKLDASGNIDVTNSDLQTLATRTGLVDGNLVQYDGTNKTLVDSGKKIGDLQTQTDSTLKTTAKTVAGAINEVKDVADGAATKAASNASVISDIQDGKVAVGEAKHATNATNVTTNINGKAITSIFETDGTTAKKATSAASADKVANKLTVGNGTTSVQFDGSAAKGVTLGTSDFSVSESSSTLSVGLSNTGVTAGTYTAVAVNAKGRVTAGGRAIAFIGKDDDIPSDVMVNGLIFRAKA